MTMVKIMVNIGDRLMRTIQASEFKAKCLALMDEVARNNGVLLITKNGKPIAELRAHRPARAKSLFGIDKGQVRILGDIVGPVTKASDWEALR